MEHNGQNVRARHETAGELRFESIVYTSRCWDRQGFLKKTPGQQAPGKKASRAHQRRLGQAMQECPLRQQNDQSQLEEDSESMEAEHFA